MAIDHNSEQALRVRKCIPLNTIPGPHYETLCKYMTIESHPKNHELFKRGDTADDLIFLLDGSVTLKTDNFIIETIAADDEHAKFSLAHQIPRKIGCIAKSNISIVRIPPKMMKKLQQSNSNVDNQIVIEESEEEASGDWMTRLLKSPIFQLLPAANMQKTLISLKESSVKAGSTIIEQGDAGDYFYIIKQGKCSLTRKPSKNAKAIILGKMATGDSFGEAAILSDKPRELTVTALSDVALLTLSKEHFFELIRKPSLTFINPITINQEQENGSLLIDIRTADEFQEFNIEGSINIPYFSVRMAAKTLDQNRKIMIICEDGKLSEAAAFNLIRSRLTVAIVEGGLKKARPIAQRQKASFAIDDSTPEITEGYEEESITEDFLDELAETESSTPDATATQVSDDQTSETENTIEFDTFSFAAEDNLEQANATPDNDIPTIAPRDTSILEVKIQILMDENRVLLKANMQLEDQYNDLLRQNETLDKQLKKLLSD